MQRCKKFDTKMQGLSCKHAKMQDISCTDAKYLVQKWNATRNVVQGCGAGSGCWAAEGMPSRALPEDDPPAGASRSGTLLLPSNGSHLSTGVAAGAYDEGSVTT